MDDSRVSHGAPAAGRDAAESDNAQLLARTAEFGEYFALTTEINESWRHFAAILDPATVAEFVDRTHHAIATSLGCAPDRIPLRLAASSFQLGVAARLLSPVIGAATALGVVPDLNPDSVRWEATAHHVPRFGVTGLEWVAGGNAADAAAVISRSVIGTVLRPLNDTLQTVTTLSAKVMWGNVISAANGAVTVLAINHPEHEGRGRALIRALLDTEQLTGTAGFDKGTFVRHNCCLFYLAPDSGLCGDCVLTLS